MSARSAERAERDERIRKLRIEGDTLQHIAAAVGVTRERVRQVLLQISGPTAAEVRTARAAQTRADASRLRERIREDVVAHPGSTCEEIATRLDLHRADVRAHLAEDLRPLVVTPATTTERAWSSDEVAKALATAATFAYPLSAGDYERLLHAGEVRGPSAARIIQLYGNWAAACRQAGVEPTAPRREGYQSSWTDADILGFVRDYLRSPECKGTFDGYDPWRRRSGSGAPSSALLRNRLGTWRDIKRKALEA